MTYEDVVHSLRKTFEQADARRIYEHIAFELVIVGEASGVLYFEVANRACVIEPYNYYDNDGVLTATAEAFLQLADLKIHLKEAIESGLIQFRGNDEKMKTCLENIRLPGVEYDKW